jgi:hypothetical protein
MNTKNNINSMRRDRHIGRRNTKFGVVEKPTVLI